ncbi:MAG TPA: hypothetical protein VGD78_01780, partial [Chthoniobacterales bacterium]
GLLQALHEANAPPVTARSNPPMPAPAPVKSQGKGRKPAAAQAPRGRGRRSTSPSGPLAPAVVAVLQAKGAPMGVGEILEALLASGYQYRAADPKKNLFARIYRLKGVQQVGPGQFASR